MKRILIVSNSFYPKNSPRSFRTTELAKEFARQGHDVTVLTHKDFSIHEPYANKYGIILKDMGGRGLSKIDAHQKGFLRLVKKMVKRGLEQFLYYPSIQLRQIVYNSVKNEEGYDLMISIAAPHSVHWGVAKAYSKGYRPAKTWVADCGDPFMFADNMHYKRPFYFSWFEKSFCKKADTITVPTQDAIEGYYPEFRDKIRVIPQGFRFEEVKIGKQEKLNDAPVFAYAGTVVVKRRDPRNLVRYLLSKNIDFTFYVYTQNHSLLAEYEKKHPDKIIQKKYINRLELLKELSKMDFMLNYENKGNTQTPSKLIDYAILDKPILSIQVGNLDTELVDQFMKGDYSRKYIVGDVEQYRIEHVINKFLELADG
ncbi:MAG: glycosyltransferase [Cyclobacteriaceae bacterium]|nr:glycosyltransferase [Cyclobacteriaceae bacterium]